jgi:hypothetical protein
MLANVQQQHDYAQMGRVMGEFTSAKKRNIDTIRLGIDQKFC